MKRLALTLAILLAGVTAFVSAAQDETVRADTLSRAAKGPSVDSTLLGKNIMELVKVTQSGQITDSMYVNISRSSIGHAKGYRVRIFFSNAQNAREESAAAVTLFSSICPEHAAYRSFVNPNFKVTVGDFLNKSEALVLKTAISGVFPSAFVVREDVNLTY